MASRNRTTTWLAAGLKWSPGQNGWLHGHGILPRHFRDAVAPGRAGHSARRPRPPDLAGGGWLQTIPYSSEFRGNLAMHTPADSPCPATGGVVKSSPADRPLRRPNLRHHPPCERNWRHTLPLSGGGIPNCRETAIVQGVCPTFSPGDRAFIGPSVPLDCSARSCQSNTSQVDRAELLRRRAAIGLSTRAISSVWLEH